MRRVAALADVSATMQRGGEGREVRGKTLRGNAPLRLGFILATKAVATVVSINKR